MSKDPLSFCLYYCLKVIKKALLPAGKSALN
jgi:hypothetical protein